MDDFPPYILKFSNGKEWMVNQGKEMHIALMCLELSGQLNTVEIYTILYDKFSEEEIRKLLQLSFKET